MVSLQICKIPAATPHTIYHTYNVLKYQLQKKEETMKAINRLFIIALISSVFLGCGKESQEEHTATVPFQPKEAAPDSFSFQVVNDSCSDYWKLLNADSNIWSWRRFHLGEFVGELDCLLEDEDDINNYTFLELSNNSFRIDYSDGNTIHVFDLNYHEDDITFYFSNNEEDSAFCTIHCSIPINIMEIMAANSLPSKMDDRGGATFSEFVGKCVKRAFHYIREKNIPCRNHAMESAKLCNNCSNCHYRFLYASTSVECLPRAFASGDCLCSNYSYYCH